ncbi:hypothetical protein HID58_014306 [Brassica napus]|uniref:Uncharacterized protein n=1 Tax=Brassica napus TaxID=3708 RepID=A0ABQ8DGW1_BRANA|nr:hypothetical protein HID58_014306 [Brassica napus]
MIPKQLQQSGVAAWREGYRSSTWTHDAAVEAREDQDDCARASAMRKFVDKMITLGKDGSLHKRRQVIYEKQIVNTGKCKDQGTDKDKEDNEDNTRGYAANAPSWFTLNLGHDQTIIA